MKAKSCETSNGSENSLNPKLSRPRASTQWARGDVMMSAKAAQHFARINLMKNLSFRSSLISFTRATSFGKMCKEEFIFRGNSAIREGDDNVGFVCFMLLRRKTKAPTRRAKWNKSSHNQPEATRRSQLRR
jgi:hypothetical protein